LGKTPFNLTNSNRFGNAYNNEERHIASGYDNGDLKFFDLKTN